MNNSHAKALVNVRQSIKVYFILFLLGAMALFFFGCGGSVPKAPDYSQDSSWIRRDSAPDKAVDVFYVYPTIYTAESPVNMDIQNADLRQSAKHIYDMQASVYFKSANMFAPYYRQMSITELDPDADMYQNEFFKLGYEDVSRAFEYYLKNLNDGRPFILAGHSQGSMVLIALLREHFNDSKLQEQLVAAYIIGYSVTPDDFKNYPWMRPAAKADDIGVIISYNTQAPGATGSPVLLPGAYCINPLNWMTDETPADKSLNLGAVFFKDTTDQINREVVNYVGAYVDQNTGALITSPPDKYDSGPFPKGVYHKYDYNFWYRNLEKNVGLRCESYLDQNSK